MLSTRPIILPSLTHLEDVLEPLEGHDDDAGVVDRQGVAERLDAASVYKAADLVGSAAGGRVAEGPGGLLLNVVLGRGQHPNERHNQVGVEHRLDLILLSSRTKRWIE